MRSGTDAKWTRLAELLLDANAQMIDDSGGRRKLIVFTEHRDTLNYLAQRIRTLLGRPEAVVEIHGGLHRELRRTAQETFLQDPETHVLVATDAAGEGVNLQKAHLLVNDDLPWNPNRIEQRFGASTASVRPRSATCGTSSPTRPAKGRSSTAYSRSSPSSRRSWGARLRRAR